MRPSREPPAALVQRYTLDGAIPMEHFYVDDTDHGKKTHYTYLAEDLAPFLAEARRAISAPARMRPPHRWLAEAIVGEVREGREQQAVVFGSSEPWVESLLLASGAANVTTVDYNYRTYEDSRLQTVIVAEYEPAARFDVAIAHGAFDHDGLGRYGDPLNPDGDLLAMRSAWRSLRPGGIFLLSLPVGPDLVVWNLHRRYGDLRLPRMLAGWEELRRVGWESTRIHTPADHRRRYEPVFVLRRNASDAEEDLELLPHINTSDSPTANSDENSMPLIENEALRPKGEL